MIRPGRTPLSRRTLLRGAGGVAVALPLLESLAPRAARAGGAPSFGYIQIHVPQGTRPSAWTPAGSGRDFVLSPILQPLADHQGDIVVVSGVHNQVATLLEGANAHGISARSLFTCMPFAESIAEDGSLVPGLTDGNGGGISFDQLIASRIGAGTPVRSLDCGIGEDSGQCQSGFAGPSDPVGYEHDPRAAFERIFGGFEPDGPTTIAKLHASRQSVLDTVLHDFDRVRAKVGSADRARLDAHAEKIRELERRLASTPEPGPACTVPALTLPDDFDPLHSDYDDASMPAFIDLMVMAFACGLTNVGTLHFTNANDPRFPFLGLDIPAAFGTWHTMIHDGPSSGYEPIIVAAMQWYSAQLAYLLDRLADTPDGDGTLLDRVLVLAASELGDGQLHSFTELPIVLAGRAGGRLETGRHVVASGTDLGGLFTGLLQLLGWDDESFGWPDACGAPLVL